MEDIVEDTKEDLVVDLAGPDIEMDDESPLDAEDGFEEGLEAGDDEEEKEEDSLRILLGQKQLDLFPRSGSPSYPLHRVRYSPRASCRLRHYNHLRHRYKYSPCYDHRCCLLFQRYRRCLLSCRQSTIDFRPSIVTIENLHIDKLTFPTNRSPRTDKEEDAFGFLKEALISESVLRCPRIGQLFINDLDPAQPPQPFSSLSPSNPRSASPIPVKVPSQDPRSSPAHSLSISILQSIALGRYKWSPTLTSLVNAKYSPTLIVSLMDWMRTTIMSPRLDYVRLIHTLYKSWPR
jgi:hypothetical protein